MKERRRWVWERLCEEGLASGELASQAGSSPWYVNLLLGVAAWVSAVLGLAGSAVVLHLSVGEHFGAMAVIWTAVGIGLLFAARTAGVFVAQLGLAAAMAGEIAGILYFASQAEAVKPTLMFAVLLLLALLPVLPDTTARVLNTLGACLCWVLLVSWSALGEPWDWRDATAPSLTAALAVWLLCWLPVLGLAFAIVASEARWMASAGAPMLRAVLAGLLIALALATPISDPLGGLLFWQGTEISDGRRDWLALWPLLSMLAAVAAAAMAFHQRNRGLLFVGLAGVLMQLGHFYYQLGVGLLVKSLVMLLMGTGLLLAARYARPLPAAAEPQP